MGWLAYPDNVKSQAERNLLRYGRTLLQNRPAETTDVLIDLCSGNFLSKQKSLVARLAQKKHPEQESESQAQQTSVNYLSYLGYDKVTGVFSSSTAANGKAAEHAPVEDAKPSDDTMTSNDQSGDANPVTTYTIPSPRQYFAHFISNPGQFMRFLESLAADRWNQTVSGTSASASDKVPRKVEQPIELGSPTTDLDPELADQRCIWNTLLELYLTDGHDSTSSTSAVSRRKALNVIDRTGDLPLDPMHALMVCSTAGFTSGQIRLWEKLGMYEEVLRFWMNAPADETPSAISENQCTASENVLHYLHLYGPSNPSLYPLVLRYLSSDSKLMAQHAKDVRDILDVIDEENLMPPLAVVQLLSRNAVTTIGVVKDWLRAKVADTRHDVESVSTLSSYRCPYADLLLTGDAGPSTGQVIPNRNGRKAQGDRELGGCSTSASVPSNSLRFMWWSIRSPYRPLHVQTQLSPTVCSACDNSSGHSLIFFNRCLPDADPECPSCARQYAVIREIRRHQQELAGRHDLFLSEVAEADDGFGVIAEAFGRGLLNKPVHT